MAGEGVQESASVATKALLADVAQAIQNLLEQKHLYQSVTLEFVKTREVLEREIRQQELRAATPSPGGDAGHSSHVKTLDETFDAMWEEFGRRRWKFVIEGIYAGEPANVLQFRLPTIRIAWASCDGVLPPHNPGFRGNAQQPFDVVLHEHGTPVQLIVVPYQCQNCKGEPLVFLLRRDGFKLQIIGRSQFEQVDVPKSVPKEERRFYRDAIISFNSGRGLAALFFFRTFIEQYMRRITGISDFLIRGDELAEKYHRMLDPTFPERFRTFRMLYGDLSDRLHRAVEDGELYATAKKQIDEHFEMLRMIPIPRTQSQ